MLDIHAWEWRCLDCLAHGNWIKRREVKKQAKTHVKQSKHSVTIDNKFNNEVEFIGLKPAPAGGEGSK